MYLRIGGEFDWEHLRIELEQLSQLGVAAHPKMIRGRVRTIRNLCLHGNGGMNLLGCHSKVPMRDVNDAASTILHAGLDRNGDEQVVFKNPDGDEQHVPPPPHN